MLIIFCIASEILESDELHLFLLTDDTRINDNEYLEGSKTVTESTVCTKDADA